MIEMDDKTTVTSIMTDELVLLNLKDGLVKAEHLFKKHNIRHIPVVNDEEVVGMLSYSDLLRISFADAVEEDEENVETTVYDMFDIHQVMTKNVVCVESSTTIQDTAEILASREFHALPVVSEEKIVGIVTTTDLIKYLLAQY